MAFRRMTRMISFRVSQEEFEQLRVKSQIEGARSISDFARLALSGAASSAAESVHSDGDRLSDEIQQLSAEVRRLKELLEGPRRSPQERPPISSSHRKAWRNITS